MDADRLATDLAKSQYGMVSVTQMLGMGFDHKAISRRRASGTWTRMRRGVYCLGPFQGTFEARCMAVVLESSMGAVVSHKAAAYLLGLTPGPPPRVEVCVPGRITTNLDHVIAHKTTIHEEIDRTFVGPIPVTLVARTIVDLSGRSDHTLNDVGRLFDTGLMKSLVTAEQVREVAERLRPARGRSLGWVRVLIQYRSGEAAKTKSPGERRTRAILRKSGLPEPKKQYKLVVDGHPMRLDLSYPDFKVCIEYDGYDFHRMEQDFHSDRYRDSLLIRAGWIIVRVSKTMSEQHIADTVRAAIQHQEPHAMARQ